MANELGQAIRRRREAQGLSLRALAERAGIPFTTLRDIEAGRSRSPGIGTLEPILAALGTTIAQVSQTGEQAGGIFIQSATQVTHLLTEWSQLTPDQQDLALALIRTLRSHSHHPVPDPAPRDPVPR